MKKIVLYIQTSGSEIFQRNTKALVDGYRRIISKYNLNIDIKSVCGVYPDREYFEDIVFWDINDKDICAVNFEAVKMLVDMDYDVIVKTNTNTVVNLQLLQAYCDCPYFEPTSVYTNIVMNPNTADYPEEIIQKYTFPNGMFIMASKDAWKAALEHFDDAVEIADKYFLRDVSINHGNPECEHISKQSSTYWSGYCDDFMMGMCFNAAGFRKKIMLRNSTISLDKLDNFGNIVGDSLHDDINETYLVINCKMDNEYPDTTITYKGSYEEWFRTQYEHYMITTICKIFEVYKPTHNDLDVLCGDIWWFE